MSEKLIMTVWTEPANVWIDPIIEIKFEVKDLTMAQDILDNMLKNGVRVKRADVTFPRGFDNIP